MSRMSELHIDIVDSVEPMENNTEKLTLVDGMVWKVLKRFNDYVITETEGNFGYPKGGD